MAGPFAFARAH